MKRDLLLIKSERRITELRSGDKPRGKARPGKKQAAAPKSESKAQGLFQAQNAPKKLRKVQVLEQWIEITVKDGITTTTLRPSNEELIEVGKTMDPPPEYVYRRMHFVNGVPEEYAWVGGTPEIRERGGCGIQRMLVDTWLEVIEREKQVPGGHVGPCGGNLPRPKERGGCDCEVCRKNAAILEGRG